MIILITFILIILISSIYIIHDTYGQIIKYEAEDTWYEFGRLNKYEAYIRCIDIIKSCKTHQQWVSAACIPNLHYQLYNDIAIRDTLEIEHTYAKPDKDENIKKNK